MSDIKFNEAIDKLCDEYYPDFPSCEFHNLIDTLKFEHEALRKSHAELEAKIRQKKGFYSISVGQDPVKQAHKAGILKGLDIAHTEIKKFLSEGETK